MDFDAYFAALVELFRPLHRKGPGSDAFSRAVRDRLEIDPSATVLDMGCGTGPATFVLAERFKGTIYGLDLSQEYIDELNRVAAERGYDNVRGVQGTMDDPPFDPGSLDLIWCDASIYITGFTTALQEWKPLLSPGGYIVASDPVWLSSKPSPECHMFWLDEYPDMSKIETRVVLAEAAGYEVIGVEAMPRECWWEEFYQPLEQRMDKLEAAGGLDTAMKAVIESTRKEVDIFKQYYGEYGGAFFVLQRG